MSLKLLPHVREIYGVDISDAMLAVFGNKLQGQGNAQNISANKLDIFDSQARSSLEGQFDVVVTLLAYHHIEDIATTTKTLAQFLRPGGKLVVVDFVKDGRGVHTHASDEECAKESIHYRAGIDKSTLKDCFNKAGLTDNKELDILVDLWVPEADVKDTHSGNTSETRTTDGRAERRVISDLVLVHGQQN